MKNKILFALVFTFVCLTSYSQIKPDTTYFNRKWEESTSKKFKYYRITEKKDYGYLGIDYYKNGELLSKAEFSSVDPEILNGLCICYTKNGKVLDSAIYTNLIIDKEEFDKQFKIFSDGANYSIKNKNIDSLSHTINSGIITIPKLYSQAYLSYAVLLKNIYKKEIEEFAKGDTFNKKIINEVLSNYEKSIQSYEKYKLVGQQDRLNFLYLINDTGLFYKQELNKLKSYGYKDQFQSLHIGIDYMYGKDHWIGGSFSILGYVSPGWKYGKTDSTHKEYIIPYHTRSVWNFLTFSILHNPLKSLEDFSFSLVSVSSPYLINLTKIGAQQIEKDSKYYWYYRPEIGLGLNNLSIGYSYNFTFKKSERPNAEKHLINIKFTMPIYQNVI